MQKIIPFIAILVLMFSAASFANYQYVTGDWYTDQSPATGSIVIAGYTAGESGTIYHSTGSLTTGMTLLGYDGDGAFYLSDGTAALGTLGIGYTAANTSDGHSGSGYFEMTGGTLEVSSMAVGDPDGAGYFKMTGGELIINSSFSSNLNSTEISGGVIKYKGSVDISDFNIVGNCTVSYDNVTGYNIATVTAPEPATMAILGLGLLFARKRQ